VKEKPFQLFIRNDLLAEIREPSEDIIGMTDEGTHIIMKENMTPIASGWRLDGVI